MLHSTDHGLDKTEGVERCFLPSQMIMPKIGDGSVRRFEFLDEVSICTPSDQVRCDETRRTMNLCNLICQHVSVVVMSRHPKPTIRPPDKLHGSSIRDQVLQFTATTFQKSSSKEEILVFFVEDLFHGSPVPFLPLEDCFLRNDVRCNLMFQTTFEEEVCQFCDVVVRVVIHDDDVVFICQVTFVNNERWGPILGKVRRK
mmetsp:Transcript_24881/g.59069  ORF Transcript_24881/g.59069 Transcript_24881/m.59069 type:complete len:200 (-) Transcript_24881:783-1382(-)